MTSTPTVALLLRATLGIDSPENRQARHSTPQPEGRETMANGTLTRQTPATAELTDETLFRLPITATGNGTTLITLTRAMQDEDFRKRALQAETAVSDTSAQWAAAAQRRITALCPGWHARYDLPTGNWLARRTSGSGYYDSRSPRTYAVKAPGALELFARIERQSLADIEYSHPDWYAFPSDTQWNAVADAPPGKTTQVLHAGTATILHHLISGQPAA